VFIHALRHAIQNPSFRINDNVVRCPCLPGDAYPVGGNWEEQDPSKYLTLQWDVTNPGTLKQLGGVQFGRDGDAAACLRRDAVTDNVIKGWLHADPSARKITGQKKDAGECLAFMKSMFQNEKDEVDKKAVRKTFHSLNQKVHREMQEDNMQGAHLVVYNGPIANKIMEGFMDLENKWMTMANFEQFRTKWCSELAPNQMSTSKYNVQACVLAAEATVLIEDYLGGGSLSDEKLNTVKVMPIDASWTRVAAEYAFSRLEWEAHHAPKKLKPLREFQTVRTHDSEDEFLADAETV